MSGTSNVGGRGVYEAGDQRNVKNSEIQEADRYNEGQPNSHVPTDSSKLSSCVTALVVHVHYLHMPEDERSIANRLAREEKAGKANGTR